LATVQKEFKFISTLEDWVRVGSRWTYTWSSDGYGETGSIQNALTGRNFSSTAQMALSTTWEDLGVPAGSEVTNVQLLKFYTECFSYADVDSASIGPFRVIATGIGGGLVATLNSARTFTGTAGWINTPGTLQSVDPAYEASDQTLRIEFDIEGDLANVPLPVIGYRTDNIQLEITYTDHNKIITSTVNVVTTTDGIVSRIMPTSGAVASTTSTIAGLVIPVFISGTIDSTTDTTGVIYGYFYPSGFIDGVTSTTSTLIAIYSFSGSIDSTTQTTSSVIRLFGLSGTIDSSTSSTTTLTTIYEFSGTIDSSTQATGTIIGNAYLTGSIDSITQATSTLESFRILSGTIDSTTSSTGSLYKVLQVSGTISSTTSSTAELAVSSDISGTLASTTQVTSTLSTQYEFSGTIASSTSSAGALIRLVAISGSIDSTTLTTSSLLSQYAFSGSIASTTSSVSALTRTYEYSGSIDSTTLTTSSVILLFSPSGTIGSSTSSESALGAEYPFSGTIDSTTSTTGNLSQVREVSGSIDSTTSIVAFLFGPTTDISGTIASTTSTTSTLYVEKPIYIGSGYSSQGTVGTSTISLPYPACKEGDLLVLTIFSTSGNLSYIGGTWISGWTKFSQSNYQVYNYYRYADRDYPTIESVVTAYGNTISSISNVGRQITAFRHVKLTGIFEEIYTTHDTDGNEASIPSKNPGGQDRLAFAFGAHTHSFPNGELSSGPIGWTPVYTPSAATYAVGSYILEVPSDIPTAAASIWFEPKSSPNWTFTTSFLLRQEEDDAKKYSGKINSTTSTEAHLERPVHLTGTIDSTTTTAASVEKYIYLSGSIDSTTDTTSNISESAQYEFSGTISSTTGTTGEVVRYINLPGTIASTTSTTGGTITSYRDLSGTINSTTSTFGFFMRSHIYSRVFDFDDVDQFNEFYERAPVGADWASSWEISGGHDETAPDDSPYLKFTNDTPLVTPASFIRFTWDHPITELGVPAGKFVKQIAANVVWVRCDFQASQTIAGRVFYWSQGDVFQSKLATGAVWPGSTMNTWYDLGAQDPFRDVLAESSSSTDNIRFDIETVAWRSTPTPTEVRYDWIEIQIIADDTNTLDGSIDSTTQATAALETPSVINITGAIASSTTTSASLRLETNSSGTITSTTSSTASIIGNAYLTGSIDSSTSTSGSIIGNTYLTGSIDSSTSAQATIIANAYLSGTIASSTSTSGEFESGFSASGSIDSSTQTTSILDTTGTVQVSGTIASTTLATSTLAANYAISGSIDSSTLATASILADAYFSGTIDSSTSTSGSFLAEFTIEVSGTIASSTSTSGAIILTLGISGSIDSTTSTEGAFIKVVGLLGTIDSSTGTDAALTTDNFLTGTIVSTTSTQGTLSTIGAVAIYPELIDFTYKEVNIGVIIDNIDANTTLIEYIPSISIDNISPTITIDEIEVLSYDTIGDNKMRLKDFHTGTTKRFDVNITYDGSPPNITNDSVGIYFSKTKEGEAVITSTADVTTSGASGVAIFTISEVDTDVTHGKYYYQIVWTLDSSEEFMLDDSSIQLLERI